MTEAQVQEICSDAYMDSETMTPREKAAVLWAEHVTRNTAKTRDDVFCEVRRHFDDREFVELTMVITYFNMRNRFQDALRIPLDEPKTISGITIGRRQDPENLKAYLAEVVADWPESFPGPVSEDGSVEKPSVS